MDQPPPPPNTVEIPRRYLTQPNTDYVPKGRVSTIGGSFSVGFLRTVRAGPILLCATFTVSCLSTTIRRGWGACKPAHARKTPGGWDVTGGGVWNKGTRDGARTQGQSKDQ